MGSKQGRSKFVISYASMPEEEPARRAEETERILARLVVQAYRHDKGLTGGPEAVRPSRKPDPGADR